MEEKIMEIFLDVLKLRPEEMAARMDDPAAWSSLARVEVLFSIEEEFDITLDETVLKEADTPEKLLRAALKQINET